MNAVEVFNKTVHSSHMDDFKFINYGFNTKGDLAFIETPIEFDVTGMFSGTIGRWFRHPWAIRVDDVSRYGGPRKWEVIR